MERPDVHSDDLQARVTRLERRQRSLRPLAGLAAVAMVAVLVASATEAPATRSPEVIQARRVELVNSKGKPQATLAADSTGVVLTLLDPNGRVAAALRLNEDPRVSVLDDAWREVAGLGAPRTRHLDH